MRRLMLLSVAALISFLAVAARTEKSTVAANFSDREIFEGVVFGVGPVAQRVPEARDQLRPEIYARNADELASMAQVRASLLASIERAEPGLVGEFARVARSGDPAAIRAMLERATEAVNAAAEEETGGLDGTLLANIPNPNPRQRPLPGPRPTPQLKQDAPLLANIPNPNPRQRPLPGPRPTPQLQQDAPLLANIPNPNPRQRPLPGPRPTPQLQQDAPLLANIPNPNPRQRPLPGPRPTPQLQQDAPLLANIPNPNPRQRPLPGPRPTPQLQQDAPLLANIPNPNPRQRPLPGPRPTPQLTAPQLAAQPAWALFSSQLFTEQLAGSMALQLERIEG